MKTFVTTSLFFILYTTISFFYLSSFMNFDVIFGISLVALVGSGMLITQAIKLFAQIYSPIFVSILLLSLVVGCIAAAMIVASGKVIFGTIAFPATLEILFRFLLPFTTTILSFWSIKFLFHSLAVRQGISLYENDSKNNAEQKFFIPDLEALEDGRIVDLARTGLFDGQIVIPSFLHKESKTLSESFDEILKQRGRRALDSIRRLESFQKISTKIKDVSAPETGSLTERLVQAARSIHATIITSEFSPLKIDAEPGLYLAIDSIANAVRIPIPKGEFLSIKIQRLGKEPKQGIGYLDDGTMVVVNGGGDHLGKSIKTQVLSQKYSSSGKIVFCNVRDEALEERTACLNFSSPL